MSLEKVSRLFGVVPRIVEGISDDAGVLSDVAKRRIRAAANEMSILFPQTRFSVVTSELAADTSLPVFAFWIFNDAGIARELDRAFNNHDILLTLDPPTGRASLMVGYGLESYISEQQLGAIVESARQDFEQGSFAAGIEQIISSFSSTLSDTIANLESTHGVTPIVSAKTSEVEVAPSDF